MKNGQGRFFYLDHGQLFEGFWVDDVAKCGTMIDFGRDEVPEPTRFPIPEVSRFPGTCSHTQRERKEPLTPLSQGTDEVKLLDPDGVLKEALAMFQKTEKEGD
ncbi:Hypothetical predicted protein [Marmota monax]|uniref:Uncharacterized protein n=1 Tax=Marmota monax TaxID=9995 RepID=A0A5E4ARD4_MARMO|nr:hypothetical protein GHT09_004423 [Marmota monax]VTJ59864.1 Hypothetical predicted protein [Marmota monax]